MALTQVNGGMLDSVAQQVGFRNRIINGAMMIDQRNAGASVVGYDNFSVDRWMCLGSQNSKYTGQQNAGSVTPPAGFVNYLGLTSSSAYTVGSSENFGLRYRIEGLNVSDLGWGAAGAASITISFWVRSSLTGTFGGAVQNSAANRSYPFSYTISSAGTWEQKTVTIAGDTTGTWLTTNGTGMSVFWSIGTGATLSGTAGSWAGANYQSATGATSVVGTNGATFYITGVQLEKGSTATSFDYRPYGTELSLCQRYYEKSYNIDVKPATNTAIGSSYGYGSANNGGSTGYFIKYAVSKRATPTITYYTNSGTSGQWEYERSSSSGTVSCSTGGVNGSSGTLVYAATSATAFSGINIWGQWTSESEL